MASTELRLKRHFFKQPVVILGAGIIGCAIAYNVLKEGYSVVLVADKLPGCQSVYYPSQWAGASWHFSKEGSKEDKYLQAITFRVWSKMRNEDGPQCGVMPVHTTEFYATGPAGRASFWAEGLTSIITRTSADRQMPDPYEKAIEYDSLVLDPNFHLPYLKQKIEQMGGRFLEKKVHSLADLHAMFPQSRVLVNASGCGSKDLIDVRDEKCFWERGQNIFFKTDKTDEVLIGHAAAPKEYTYVIPRPLQGGVILGGVKQPGNL
ncbi:putative fad dependent oxidoreductase superfamily protein [Phaeoacremonium minimum UCRPA7]|uniref:Putative fad dependent oxidoreductase superfamily protein n=1 Tax=Phaeoacremonium minimum (strain UCR-PA7) TaxID=1286976 RepID=R8BNM9_PHAM7|nr:putative fad dependent oxidoreductase superfamily protein [Phaeoacremonium minimum UCRPA7]EOO01013.1 putative fad dependent oxidoreductase superfamily protein [Phaeoacremonium minimum UCRPA7]